MTAMVVVLSVTEFCNKMSVTNQVYMYIQVRLSSHTHIHTTYVHVNNYVSKNNRCITYILHTSHIKCGMAAQLFLSVSEFARRAWTSQVYNVNFP